MPINLKEIQLKDFQIKEDSQSLYRAVKDNPKDKIELELGDSKDATDFHPQAKIQRWDNEVNLSITYSALVLAIMADKTEKNVLVKKGADDSLSITLL